MPRGKPAARCGDSELGRWTSSPRRWRFGSDPSRGRQAPPSLKLPQLLRLSSRHHALPVPQKGARGASKPTGSARGALEPGQRHPQDPGALGLPHAEPPPFPGLPVRLDGQGPSHTPGRADSSPRGAQLWPRCDCPPTPSTRPRAASGSQPAQKTKAWLPVRRAPSPALLPEGEETQPRAGRAHVTLAAALRGGLLPPWGPGSRGEG